MNTTPDEELRARHVLNEYELKALLTSPEAMRALADYHDYQQTLADASDFPCEGNEKKRLFYKAEAERLEREWQKGVPEQRVFAALARQEEGREAVAGVPLEKIAAHTELMAAGPLHMSGHTDAVGQAIKLIRAGGSGYRKPTPPIAALAPHSGGDMDDSTRDEMFGYVDACADVLRHKGKPIMARELSAIARRLATPTPQAAGPDLETVEARDVSLTDVWAYHRDRSISASLAPDAAKRHGAMARVLHAALTAAGAAPEGWQQSMRAGPPPEPVSHPSQAWCDAYAEWYEAATPQPGAQHGQEGRE